MTDGHAHYIQLGLQQLEILLHYGASQLSVLLQRLKLAHINLQSPLESPQETPLTALSYSCDPTRLFLFPPLTSEHWV